MKNQPSPLTWEEHILALAIARAIRVSRDERDAVRRVCILLGVWEIDIDPSELGSFARDQGSRSSLTPSP